MEDKLGKLGKLGKLDKPDKPKGVLMKTHHIDSHVLETFVAQKYHWKSLNHEQQMAMAVELMRHRYIERKLYKFIESIIEDKEGWQKYRELLVMEASKI